MSTNLAIAASVTAVSLIAIAGFTVVKTFKRSLKKKTGLKTSVVPIDIPVKSSDPVVTDISVAIAEPAGL